MFKLNPKTSFTAQVALTVPGEKDAQTVGIEFKHLNRKAIQGFFADIKGKTDAEALSELIIGWEGFDAPFSREALETLLDNYPAAAEELFQAYRSEFLEARRKN